MKKSFGETLWEWFKALVVAGVLAVIVRYFIFIPLRVEGDSMEPALQADSYLLFHKVNAIDRFDIILFRDDNGEVYIKRVVGLPGETVAYQDDMLFIDGQRVLEPFLDEAREENQIFTTDFTIPESANEQKIPSGHYFVLGDNRPRSKDSRMFGFVPFESVEGTAKVVIYPFDQMHLIK